MRQKRSFSVTVFDSSECPILAEAVEKLFGKRLARNFLRTERQHAALIRRIEQNNTKRLPGDAKCRVGHL